MDSSTTEREWPLRLTRSALIPAAIIAGIVVIVLPLWQQTWGAALVAGCVVALIVLILLPYYVRKHRAALTDRGLILPAAFADDAGVLRALYWIWQGREVLVAYREIQGVSYVDGDGSISISQWLPARPDGFLPSREFSILVDFLDDHESFIVHLREKLEHEGSVDNR